MVEIAYNPGVMDPWEESTSKGIRDLGIEDVISVKTGRQYLISGRVSREELDVICEKLLYNRIIQHIVNIRDLKKTLAGHREIGYKFKRIEVDLAACSDQDLIGLSKDRQLYLTLDEMRTIRDYFAGLGRNPSDCELETIAQTWSEHCVHKTMRGNIEYTDVSRKGRPQDIKNLLKSTVMKATRELNKSWCVSVFKDNAGIIKFDKDHNICFKVETHNHPSALDPYGGAGTGIGGVIRDVLGVGRGAKPVLNTDVFCFGNPEMKLKDVPKGVLHPKRIMKGVVSGVRDYGNRMGIPTVNGAVLFDGRYTGNPLVFCGTLGIMPRDCSFKKVSSGEYIVAVGGRTGRDGIHGATFSSSELTHESETISSGAVQIGNAITEKKVLDTLLQAREQNLFTAITDCGAGGFSSAVGEMGQETGARVDLEKIPLKYRGLSYTEMWISEAQERMVLSVPAKNLKKLLRIFADENVEAAVIGRFTKTRRLELFYQGHRVCDLDMEFLHDGLPAFARKAVWKTPRIKEVSIKQSPDLTSDLLAILSELNVCSKEWIIRQYDHEVQGMSVLKPLAGIDNDGPQDAAVIKPLARSKKGIAVSCGINPRYSDIDPYWMAASCIDEAVRQIISVGGSLNKIAILDNFAWANTDRPPVLGELVRACQGCYDAALAYGTPFISGKDSLNNEYNVGHKKISIPSTLLISAMAVVDNVEKTISSDLKKAGNPLYCLGATYDELGGSTYHKIKKASTANVPKVNFRQAVRLFTALSVAVKKGYIAAAHDCSEGGIGVALAEMAFAGGLGMRVDLRKVKHRIPRNKLRDDVLLFSESNSRFIVEVKKEKAAEFERVLKGNAYARIGTVSEDRKLQISGSGGRMIVNSRIERLKEAWQSPLRW